MYADEDGVLLFQSTPSVWRETETVEIDNAVYRISIHSLRVEGDPYFLSPRCRGGNFNPLPPCGGRRAHVFKVR